MRLPAGLALATCLAVVPAVAHAHFKLLEPASWIIEDDRGDPQKAGPCGGTNTDYGKPSFAVGQAVGGSKLHVKVQETIYHPGHYRVALAVNSPLELPVDPKATTEPTDRGPRSVSAEIQNPVQAPVLADGLFVHTAKVDVPFETDVTLPNISCKRCTLQVIQFMEQHGVNNPGNFTYHHCATLQIAPDRTKPIDAAWPAER
ncbi:MAG TPA: SCE4755 family polysaccharide monooxygenase-like protein [Vicinamibacterales bacterium]|nr:SCE4755 family polysaccharide monooxygenase-like protein [Vicinamibacterales bacterium]